jgi:hypothetical protein
VQENLRCIAEKEEVKTVQTKFNVMVEKVMPPLHPLKIQEMVKCRVNLQNVQRLNIGGEEHQKK